MKETKAQPRREPGSRFRFPRKHVRSSTPTIGQRRFPCSTHMGRYGFHKMKTTRKRAKKMVSRASGTSNRYRPTVKFPAEYRKFLPTDLSSAWWYDRESL